MRIRSGTAFLFVFVPSYSTGPGEASMTRRPSGRREQVGGLEGLAHQRAPDLEGEAVAHVVA